MQDNPFETSRDLRGRSLLMVGILTMDLDTPASYATIVEFQESWMMGLIALVISVPCVILFWRRFISNINWQVPYLSESPNSEDNTNSSTYE